MNQTAISLLIGLVTFLLTVLTCAVMVGIRWGKLTNDVENIKTDLAEIKGMFVLRLKE